MYEPGGRSSDHSLPVRKGVGLGDGSGRSSRREESADPREYEFSNVAYYKVTGSPHSPSPTPSPSPQWAADPGAYSNRLNRTQPTTRTHATFAPSSRRVVTQGETVVRHHTYYPPVKNPIGMVGPQSSPKLSITEVAAYPKAVATETVQPGLATALKELSYLYRDGDLSMEEYGKAKEQVIAGESEKSLAAMLDELDEGEVEYEAPAYNPRVPGVGYTHSPDSKDKQIAALLDENTGLRAVTDRLTMQLTSSNSGGGGSKVPNPTPTPQAQRYDIVPTKPLAKPITPPSMPTGDWSLHTLRSPV